MANDYNVYMTSVVFGLFTGLGYAVAQWIFKKYFEERFNHLHTGISKRIKHHLRKR